MSDDAAPGRLAVSTRRLGGIEVRLVSSGDRRPLRPVPLTRLVLPVALALVTVHVVVTAIRLSGAWWWQDDLYILGLVADRPLTPALLFENYNGHLVPATWLMGWLVSHLAPLAWWPSAVVQTVLVAVADLAMLALLLRMFGRRPAILLPLAAFCASSLTLTSTLWWAAALQWLPVTISLAVALYFHLGYAATGRTRDAVGAVAAVAGGLLCFEKALTVLPVLAAVSVLYLTGGPLWRRPWRALRGSWRYWAAHALLVAVYLPLYVVRTTVVSAPSEGLADVAEQIRQMALYTVIPGLFGGPLQWYSPVEQTLASWPDTPGPLLWVTWLLTAVLVVASLAARRGAWRAWLLLGLYLVGTVALVAQARGAILGPYVGRDLRYATDLALLAPLCAALAWLPLRGRAGAAAAAAQPAADAGPGGVVAGADAEPGGDVVAGDPDPGTPVDAGLGADVPGSRAARRHAAAGRWARRRRPLLVTGGGLAVLLVTLGGVVSGNRFADAFNTNPGPLYFALLRADLAASTGRVLMFDQPVPEVMMSSAFGRGARLAHVTRPLEERPRIVEWAPAVQVVTPGGRLRPGTVTGNASVLAQPACTAPTSSAPLVVPLAGSAPVWEWHVKVHYFANATTPAVIQVGAGRRAVQLETGEHDVFVHLVGGGPSVTISGTAPGTQVCVSQAVVGALAPAS